jgi:hypothetical protein
LPLIGALVNGETVPKFSTPTWEVIRTIGRSKIMTLTILIPFLGYMIIFNEHLIHLFELSDGLFSSSTTSSSTNQNVVSEDSKTRLFYFYFGFTFLGLGSLLFQFFCPNLIKEHGSDREFIKEEVSLMTIKRTESLLRFIEVKVPEKIDELSLLSTDFSFAVNGLKSNEEKIKNAKETIINLMLMQWQFEVLSNKTARRSVSVFYVLGFIILAVPSLEMFCKVVMEFIS